MKNTKMMKMLNGEMAKFDDVAKLEEVKEAVILTMKDTVEEIKDSVHNFASIMSLSEMGILEVTDEVRMSVIATMVKGALAGAVANEIDTQLKEIDSVIEFNKGTSEESKVVDFAEKKAEKEAKAEAGNDAVVADLIGELLIGSLMEAINDIKKETDGEA